MEYCCDWQIFWWIAQKKDSLWVKWVHHINMKQAEWWTYHPSVNSSWTWRQICKVRELLCSGFSLNGWMNAAYSTHDVYLWLIREHATVPWVPLVWNRLCLPKVSFICWLYVLHRLLTKDRLLRYGVVISDLCDICGSAQETHSHLFFECGYSQRCLALLNQWLDIDWTGDFSTWIITWRCRSLLRKKVIMAAVATLIYSIWQNRNTARHEGVVQQPNAVLRWIKCNLNGRFMQVKGSIRLNSSWIDRLALV
ncbi:uncharacterized protein LOC141614510 [Silene latifolia]|uniref:uncharacterized protein LOC141614510 n=1 Tax=Silene latifolia TaxID=37657 RepID=UPI003D7869BE